MWWLWIVIPLGILALAWAAFALICAPGIAAVASGALEPEDETDDD